MKTCCLCNKKFEGWGNNPWPIVGWDGTKFSADFRDSNKYICCDSCNYEHVLPARIQAIYNRNK